MKRLLTVVLLAGVALAQGGRTSSNILPATNGQTLGNSDYRWKGFLGDTDIVGNFTINGVAYSGGGGSGSVPANIKYVPAAASIDSTITSCGSSKCLVIIPASVGDGYPTSIPDNVIILDYRSIKSPNTAGSEASTYGYGELIRRTFTDSMVLNYSKGALGLYCAALSGGINRGSTEAGGWFKANYVCNSVIGTWRTPGQHALVNANANDYSIGDHFGFTTILTDWGGGSAGGDESTQGFAARLYEGEAIFSATVSGVDSDTVSFSSGSNLDTIGEGRYLINTTASKTYSTGTVASVSGNVFTFSGAGLASQFGSGDKTNLCLVLDSNTMTVGSTAHKLVNLITNIADENTLTIKWGLPESGGNYPSRLATSGNYAIYSCSPVTYAGVSYQPGTTSGSLKVSDASVFEAGDTVELPVWYQHTKKGISAYISHSGYNGGALAHFADNGPGYSRNGIVLAGNLERGIEFTGTLSSYGILFNRSVASTVPMINDTPADASTGMRRFLATVDALGNVPHVQWVQNGTTGGYWGLGVGNNDYLKVDANGTVTVNGTLSASLGHFNFYQNYTYLRDGTTNQRLQIFNTTDGTNMEYGDVGWSGNGFYSRTLNAGTGTLRDYFLGGAAIHFLIGGVDTWRFRAGGELYPTTNNAYDIGVTTNRVRSVYAGTAVDTPKLQGITDTTVVTNLNADTVDGKHAANFTAAPVTAPTNATDACTAGQWSYASGYVYVCVATNTWQRAALATW